MLSFVQDLKTAMAKAVRVVGYDGGKMVYMHAFKLSTQLSNVDTAELDLFYLSDPQTARDMLRTLHSAMEPKTFRLSSYLFTKAHRRLQATRKSE